MLTSGQYISLRIATPRQFTSVWCGVAPPFIQQPAGSLSTSTVDTSRLMNHANEAFALVFPVRMYFFFLFSRLCLRPIMSHVFFLLIYRDFLFVAGRPKNSRTLPIILPRAVDLQGSRISLETRCVT